MDCHIERALALFDAFASTEKTLHANPGDHRNMRWVGVDDGSWPGISAGSTRHRPDLTGIGVRLRIGRRYCHTPRSTKYRLESIMRGKPPPH